MLRGSLSRCGLSVLALTLLGCGSVRQKDTEAGATSSAPAAKSAPSSAPPAADAGFVAAPAMPGVNVPAIKVNTVGYAPGWRKVAIFNVEPKGAVVKAEDGYVVHTFIEAEISARGTDPASQDPVWQADFSKLDKPGRYYVEGGGKHSDAFNISAGIYKDALVAAQKHFYFQRCRTKLSEPYAVFAGENFSRDAPCHLHDDVGWDYESYPEKKKKWKLEGGWHDAGNYEIYVPSAAPRRRHS
jgi:endoglucanase